MIKADTRQKNVRKKTKKDILHIKKLIDKAKDILEVIGDGISIQARNFKIIYENKIHRDEFGDHVGEYCYKVYAKRKRLCKDCPVGLVFKDGRSHIVTKEVPTNGKTRYVEITASPLKDEEGNILAGIEVVRDITKRVTAQRAQRESETTLKTVIESLPFDFFLINEGGRYALQNTKCIQTYGDIIGKRPEDLHVKKETLELWKENNQRAFAGEVVEGEVFFKLKGKGKYYYNIISPIFDDNAVRGILGINIDITKRKEAEVALQQSEEKFRSLAEKSPNMIFINHKGRVVYANQKCEQVMGYSKTEFYSKRFDFRSLIAPEYQNKVMSAFQKHIEGEEVPPYEYDLITKDGKRIEVIITTKLIDYDNDKAVLGIVTDITERKRAERVLMQREKELQEKTQNLEELNTALKVLLEKRQEDKIQGEEKIMMNIRELVKPYLAKVKNEGLNRSQKTYIDIIESNLNEIVSSFTVRLSSGNLTLTPTEIQVANLIKQGKRSKEIAELMHSSPKAVAFHRGNIRKKLGLQNKKTNLRSYLLSCFQKSN
jgi:PAS domain S-box-containing protein